ncbi:hypothetical protein Dimus_010698 [Dionaea muscipula]
MLPPRRHRPSVAFRRQPSAAWSRGPVAFSVTGHVASTVTEDILRLGFSLASIGAAVGCEIHDGVDATPPACPPATPLESRLLRLQRDRWPSSSPRLWVDVFDAETMLMEEDENARGVGFLILEMVFLLGFSPKLCVAYSGFPELVCCSATMPLTSFRVSSLQVAAVVWWFPLHSCLRVVSMMRRLSLGIG